MTKVFEKFGLPFNYTPCSTEVFVAGVECEIEAVKNPVNIAKFTCTQDGSLRNKHAPQGHGHEFISEPLPRDELVDNFKTLHTYLQYYAKEDPFSPRTSTHVHVNCMMLTPEQVRNLLLMYALFEEIFFTLVKPDRRDNIHCVPLTETAIVSQYKMSLPHLVQQWHKYTALNLKPLTKLGSIEFRHLHGTNDVEEFSTWLKVLENLWTLAKNDEQIDQASLQSKETVTRWFNHIFAPAPKALQLRPVLFDVIRNSMIDVKFSVA